jgi:glycosyltransferase involved in cell wall biosynthesis
MLADSMGRGGTERRSTELLKALVTLDDIDTELVVFSEKIQFDELFQLGIPIHIFRRKIRKDPGMFVRLYRLCKEVRPDIIHCWGSMSAIFALPVKWLMRPVLINSIITDAPSGMSLLDYRRFRFMITAPFSDVILSNSLAGLAAYKAPADRSYCIYNGFDFNRMSHLRDEPTVRQIYRISGQKIVGMVGAFEPRKDYARFIEIANRVLSIRSDVTFMAVGGGSMFEECQKLVHPSHRKKVIFTGNVSHVESIVQVFTIGVLISNPQVHGEGISNAIMEYMAAGIPVLANDNGGNREIILHEKTGFIIDYSDLDSWVGKINDLLDNPEKALKMGQTGRERIAGAFGMPRMIQSFVDLYRRLDKHRKNTGKLWLQDQ